MYQSMEEMIGNTPIVRLGKLFPDREIYAKLELFNPAGSAKDRAALFMLDDFERRGLLPPGGTIIEPTSGNTGVALAALAARRGYKVILTMPDSMSLERRQLLKAYGARLVLTEGAKGMAGAVEKAEQLRKEIPGSVIAGQFENPANALAHERTTGPEIWAELGARLETLVAGVGTGGTLTGTARYLKGKNPALRAVAVEPAASPLLSEGKAGPHGLMGIGANFVPALLDRDLIDEIVPVREEEAHRMARRCAREEGLLIGISSAAALVAAERARGVTLAILPDGGERYLSTGIYEEEEK
ncbi:MAG TPA: cysteine synthase A [Candidatus Pullichristensenella excrementigallinarum]|uniref:Cysteine synthase n=1 Tax=Candidatus Pullichristensenella excrementigallinarum TaxID=2840907 RepID=A0A9D1ICM9_9FIRM|nr:cysteine synthase A [Candidatus Pullichristensenella excrementigallinarum]